MTPATAITTVGWNALVPGRVAISTPTKPTTMANHPLETDPLAEQRPGRERAVIDAREQGSLPQHSGAGRLDKFRNLLTVAASPIRSF